MSSNKRYRHISNEGTAFWYQAILNRYNSVNSANSNIDTKTGVVIASSVAVLIYIAQVSSQPRILSILAALGLLIAIIIGLRNIHVRNTSTEVHTVAEQAPYYAKRDKDFYWQMLADLEDSLKKVDSINKTKAKLYKWTVYLFLASSLCAMLALYIKLTITLVWK